MGKLSILLPLVCVGLASCAPANITASKWDSGVSGANVETRCEQLDMRNKSEMDSIFKKYDGWKLVYISEYTTEHKIGTDAAVCFERAK
ncbi:MAG: hypothetical protein J7K15_03235 [Deltaproteobacteria bacterium]|nr:hypothetical protein [Deltaproteobacteria bacterium]